MWRLWLIEWPATIVDWWCRLYVIGAFILTSACIVMAVLVLALAMIGIRWGW